MKFLSAHVLILLIICLFSPVYGQLIDYGQNSPGLHWQSLKTKHIELIFPSDYSIRARRLAAILEKTTFFENRSLNVNTSRIPVILQNQGVESNGFVLLAPRRSEFYTLSPSDQEPGDWLESLGLHEMRHVVQEDKVFNGHRIPLGEALQLGIFGLVFPPWFFEGDAVVMETALTASGRGRLATFKREFRVNLIQGKKYSYSKYYFGSERDNVPDYYRLGFFMVNQLRKEYTNNTYEKIFSDAISPRLWPLSTSLKKHTGYSTEKYFEHTMAELKNTWLEEYKLESHDNYRALNSRTDSVYANYLLPHISGKDSLLYLKTSLNDIPGIYLKVKGQRNEKLLTRTGLQLLSHFDYASGLLVWDEERSDPRYAYHTYSIINTMDIHSGIKKSLTHKTRLFVPSLSRDGKYIVAVHSDLQNRVELQIMESSSAKVLKVFPAREGEVFQYPRFDSSGHKIICISNSNQGKSLYEINLDSGIGKALTPSVFNDLSRPSYIKENLIAYTYSGPIKQDIYIYQAETGKSLALTNSSFGASAALSENGKVIFNNFQLRGDDIAEISLKVPDTLSKNNLKRPNLSDNVKQHSLQDTVKQPVTTDFATEKINSIETKGSVFTEQRKADQKLPLSIESSRLISPVDSLDQSIQAKPYNELSHLFNIHSILPSVKHVDIGSVTYLAGLEVLSTNLLNTMQGYAGAYYDNNVQSMQYEAGLTYKKWYPWISFYVTDRQRDGLAKGRINNQNVFVPFYYRELKYNLSLEIPLSFNIGDQSYETGAQILTSISHNQTPSIRLTSFKRDLRFPLHYTIYLLKSRMSATRDLYPTWSQNIAFTLEHFPFEKTLSGKLLYMNSNFYFPGFAMHHSFQISFNYQQTSGTYDGYRSISEISGFGFLPPNKLSNTLRLNYFFPLAYTDWQISSLAYVKRIQAGVFFDSQNILGRNEPIYGKYNTFGPDIRINCNLLRYYLPVFQLGTRLVLFEHGVSTPKIEFLVDYSL